MIKIKLTDVFFANESVDGAYTFDSEYYAPCNFKETLEHALCTLDCDYSDASDKELIELAIRFSKFYRNSNRYIKTISICVKQS